MKLLAKRVFGHHGILRKRRPDICSLVEQKEILLKQKPPNSEIFLLGTCTFSAIELRGWLTMLIAMFILLTAVLGLICRLWRNLILWSGRGIPPSGSRLLCSTGKCHVLFFSCFLSCMQHPLIGCCYLIQRFASFEGAKDSILIKKSNCSFVIHAIDCYFLILQLRYP